MDLVEFVLLHPPYSADIISIISIFFLLTKFSEWQKKKKKKKKTDVHMEIS